MTEPRRDTALEAQHYAMGEGSVGRTIACLPTKEVTLSLP